MIRGALRLQLPKEPLALLRIRQRQRLVTPHRQQRGSRGRSRRMGFNGRDKAIQARLLKQRLEWHFEVKRLAYARDHLHGEQGMPTQLEKVLSQAHTLSAEDIGPDRGNLLLQGRYRRLPIGVHRRGIRFGQRVAVELPIGVQRHAREEDQVRRHHVIRQLLAQAGLELFTGNPLRWRGQRLRGDHVSQQLVVSGQQQRFTHACLGQQQRLDLTQLDAETTDFHLVIDAPDILDDPIGATAGQVTGAVQALARAAERVGDKTFGGQRRSLQIGSRQTTFTGDIQFTHGTDRQQIQIAVEHIQRTPRQRAADRAGAGTDHRRVVAAVQHAGHHRRLGRPVGIEQAYMAEPRATPQRRAIQRHGFAADMHLAQCTVGTWAGRQAILQEEFPVGRRQVGQGDALGDNLLVQFGPVPQLRATQDHAGADSQRRVQLLDETVEVQGRKLQHPIIRGQARVARSDARKLTQSRMVDRHALGFTGRTRGVNDVSQAARFEVEPGIVFGTLRQLRIGQINVQGHYVLRQRQTLTQGRLGQHPL